MLKDIEQLKKQLSELSEVINSFKSEAVQLKILEYIFKGSESRTTAEGPNKRERGTRRRTSRPPRANQRAVEKEGAKSAGKARRGGKGAVAVLSELIEGDFFDQKRTIGDVVEHCAHTLARRFKPNEFSGALARHTRSGALKREKNADGQYEYSKP